MAGIRSLDELLDLQDGSRLTGVVIIPLGRDVVDTTGQILLQVAVGVSESSDIAAQAVGRFLPETLATIYGNQPDGSEWFATFQYVEKDAEPGRLLQVSSALLERALGLTGVEAEAVWGHPLGWSNLHAIYDYHDIDGVADWSSLDLLLGLIINLTRGDLDGLVAEVEDPSLAPAERAINRRHQFNALLHAWAASYDGPEPLAS